jgi:hypothetical protein
MCNVIALDVFCKAEIKSPVARIPEHSTTTVLFPETVKAEIMRFDTLAEPADGTKLIVTVASLPVVLQIRMFFTIVVVAAGAVYSVVADVVG